MYFLFDDQHLVVPECLVVAGDDALAGLQAFDHFVVLRILAAYANLAAVSDFLIFDG